VELANPSGSAPLFQTGMVGRAYLLTPGEKPRAAVPATAILREGPERFVLVEEASAAGASEYRKVPVVVGREADGWVEILGGHVFPGDRVVTRGGSLLGPFFTPEVLKPGPYAERDLGLKVEPARMVAVDEIITVEGVVEVPPDRRGFAASPLAGTIRSVQATPGQAVKPGDVVAEVFSPELLAVQQDLLRAHLEAGLTADTLDRLRKVRGGAARRVWELESQLAGLKSQVEITRRKLATAGLTAEQIEAVQAGKETFPVVPVRAPLPGGVVKCDPPLGEAVAAREPLFEVHDLSRPMVRGFVPERDVTRVRPSQAVRVRTVAEPGSVLIGRVVRSAGTLSGEARALSVWVELDAAPDRPALP